MPLKFFILALLVFTSSAIAAPYIEYARYSPKHATIGQKQTFEFKWRNASKCYNTQYGVTYYDGVETSDTFTWTSSVRTEPMSIGFTLYCENDQGQRTSKYVSMTVSEPEEATPRIIKHEYRSATQGVNRGLTGESQRLTVQWKDAGTCVAHYRYNDGRQGTVDYTQRARRQIDGSYLFVHDTPVRTDEYSMTHTLECHSPNRTKVTRTNLTNVITNPAPAISGLQTYYFIEKSDVSIGISASDSNGSIASYSWRQISGHPVNNWTVKNQRTINFKAPEVVTNAIQNNRIQFEVTVTDNHGKRSTGVVNAFLNDMPRNSILSPNANHKFKSTDPLSITVGQFKDLNSISRVKALIRRGSTTVSGWQDMAMNSTRKGASLQFADAIKKSLTSNVRYQFVTQAIDTGTPAAGGYWATKYFYINDKPKAASKHTMLNLLSGTSRLITHSDISISDSDDSSHRIKVLPGNGYTVQDSKVTINNNFIGNTNIALIVSDGLEDSDIVQIPVTVHGKPKIIESGYKSLAGIKNVGYVGQAQQFTFKWANADTCVASYKYTYSDGTTQSGEVTYHDSNRKRSLGNGTFIIDYQTPARDRAYSMTHKVSCERLGNVAESQQITNKVYVPLKVVRSHVDNINKTYRAGDIVTIHSKLTPTPGLSAKNYKWTQVSGPQAALNTINAAHLTFNVPSGVTDSQPLRFKLEVTDNFNNVTSMTADIKVTQKPLPSILKHRYESEYGLPNTGFVDQTQTLFLHWKGADTCVGNANYRYSDGSTETVGPVSYHNHKNVSVLPDGTHQFKHLTPKRMREYVMEHTVKCANSLNEEVVSKLTNTIKPNTKVRIIAPEEAYTGNQVNLTAEFDPIPGVKMRSIAWVQTKGSKVTLTNNFQLGTSFIAPNVNETLEFMATVVMESDAVASAKITVNIATVPPVEIVKHRYESEYGLKNTGFVDRTQVFFLTWKHADTCIGNAQYTYSDGTSESVGPVNYHLNSSVVTLPDGSKEIKIATPKRTRPYTMVQSIECSNTRGKTQSTLTNIVKPNTTITINAPTEVIFDEVVKLQASYSQLDGTEFSSISWLQPEEQNIVLTDETTLTPSFTAPRTNKVLKFTAVVVMKNGAVADKTIEINNIDVQPKILTHKYLSEGGKLNQGYVGEHQTIIISWQNADLCEGHYKYTYADGFIETSTKPVVYSKDDKRTKYENGIYTFEHITPVRTKPYSMEQTLTCSLNNKITEISTLTNIVIDKTPGIGETPELSQTKGRLNWTAVTEGNYDFYELAQTNCTLECGESKQRTITKHSLSHDLLSSDADTSYSVRACKTSSAGIKVCGPWSNEHHVIVPTMSATYFSESGELFKGYVGEHQRFLLEWQNAEKCESAYVYTYANGEIKSGSVDYSTNGPTQITGENSGRIDYYTTTRKRAYRMEQTITCSLGTIKVEVVNTPNVVENKIVDGVNTPKLSKQKTNLSWTAISDAQKYILQVAECATDCTSFAFESWQLAQENASTSFTLPNDDTKRAYRVKACFADESCTAWSNVLTSMIEADGDWSDLTPTAVDDANELAVGNLDSVDLSSVSVEAKPAVSGGQASYHIPIALPPGRAGLQPSIAINYNSQSGNGVMGMGFNLQAAGEISRCGSTYVNDGVNLAVTFDASNDKLCLNGQRLVNTVGIYGEHDTEYRTEMDSFVKVVQSNAINDSDSAFTVYYPDGSSATFGHTPNSRFSPDGLNTVLTWKLTQKADPSGNNTIDYRYDTDVAGEHLLSDIYYTGTSSTLGERRVKFIYEDRADKKHGYMQGGVVTTTRRLAKIETYRHGSDESTANWVSRYTLNYTNSVSSNRSLLDTIQRCGKFNGNTQCTLTSQFDWHNKVSTHEWSPLTIKQGNTDVQPYKDYTKALDFKVADVNGDGTLDFPGYMVDAEQSIIGTHNLPTTSIVFDVLTLKPTRLGSIDINLDGLADFITVDGQNIVYRINNGGVMASQLATDIILPNDVDSIIALLDMNGDGYPDVVTRQGDGPRERYHDQDIIVYWNTRNKDNPYRESSKQTLYSLQDFNEFTVESVSFIGDADNNGLPDMAVYGLMEFNMGITDAAPRKILFNNGQDVAMTSYNLPEPDREIIVTDPSRFHFMADINGDGLIDLLYWNKDTNNIELLYRLNLGNRSFSEQKSFGDSVFATRSYARKQGPEEPIEYTFPKYLQAIKVADTNLDGVNELLVPGELLVESCATIMERKGNTRVDTRFCGDELYGQYQDGQPGYNRPIPLSYDKSIYKYHALHFVRNETTGDIGVERRATNLVGTPESVVMDLFGDGLLDLVSAVYQSSEKGASYYPNWDREYLSVDSQGNELEGIYISRNYGAGSGITTADYQPIDYLESVTDGLGNRSQWRYRPLSTGESSADQTKLYSTAFDYHSDGYLHFASSMYVVKSFSQTNGVGGENVRHFAYKGAMFNTEGRGFTGFREIIEKDAQRNIVTSSVFEQKFPQIGLLTNQEVTSNGTVISSLEQIWRDNPEHLLTDTEHQFLQHSKLDKWDLDGTQISKKETTVPNDETGIDQYGNIKRQTVTITDYIDGETNSDSVTSIREFDSNTTGTNWWLNKLTSQQTVTSVVTRNWANDPLNTVTDNLDIARTKTVSYTDWDTLHNKPKTITVTASDVTCSIETKVVYNTYGLAISNSVEAKAGSGVGNGCSSQAKRSSSINYTKNGTSQDDAGYFPFKVTNAKSHDTTTHYDVGFGVPVKVEAPNNLESTTTLDAIGRPIQVAASGQPTKYIRYLSSAADSNNPTHGKTMVRTKAMGQPTTTVYLDSVGRELRVVTQGFASEQQIIDKEYDTQGRLLKESLPYASSMSPSFTEYGEFDALDRPNWRKLPHGLESTYSYNGLVTNITVNNERTMSRTYNSRNWLLETVDAKDGANRFSYDALGQVLVIQDAKGAKIKAHYNGFGHKYKVDDPNNGVTEFKYNTFGELTWQKDAEGVEQNINYDALGRVNSRIIRGGHNPHTANYTWDTRKEGLLSTESANGITRNYYYDDLARVNHTQITQAGKEFSIKPQYDANYGRVKGLEYPNGLTIAYQYNDNGYLTHTKNAATGYVYREITEMDWASRTTMANLADGQLELSAAYDAESSVMLSTEVTSNDRLIHGHEYTDFDMYKNLKVERDKVTQLSKSYQYDSLNRLEQYTYSNSQYGFSETIDYAFDATGNLLKKTDYSANSDTAYLYGGDSDCGSHLNVATRSNAVCQVTKADGTTVQFTYDNNGNLLTGDGLDITYNFMNKPLIVGRNSAQLTPAISRFYYGSDGARARQERTVNDQLTTTYYADKLYELDSDGAWRAYIDDIAVLSFTPERAHQIRYTLRDRLGSATTLVDHNGEVVSRRYFDPFGRTANIDADPSSFDWETLAADKRGIADLLDSGRNRRGFTDHEHLNEQQIIHMNGRVYDYNLGRFMSVDPVIQSPGNSQSINPYSYIMNNPLAGVDPTGYVAEDPELKKIEYTKTTEKVAVTGSRIKREVTTGVSGTATYSNGATQQFSATFSGGKVATMEIGSPTQISKTTSQQQNNQSTLGNKAKSIANAGLKSLTKGGIVGMGLAPTATATDEQMNALVEPIIEENVLHNSALDLESKLSKEDFTRLEKDLTRIRAKPNGPNGIQYALTASESGDYVCYTCSSGITWLNKGDVWKYGQTTKPSTRYSTAELGGALAGRRLLQVTQYRGTQRQVLLAEKLKIYTHLATTGTLPPGNKIRR